jgi:hypothetical protein
LHGDPVVQQTGFKLTRYLARPWAFEKVSLVLMQMGSACHQTPKCSFAKRSYLSAAFYTSQALQSFGIRYFPFKIYSYFSERLHMKKTLFVLIAIVAAFIGAGFFSCRGGNGPSEETISYNFHVRPILSDKCFNCHGPDANKREAGCGWMLPKKPTAR